MGLTFFFILSGISPARQPQRGAFTSSWDSPFPKNFRCAEFSAFRLLTHFFQFPADTPSKSSAAGQQAYCCPAPRSKTASFLELNASNKRKLSILTLSNRRARPPPRTTGKPVSPQRVGLVRLLRQRECPPFRMLSKGMCHISWRRIGYGLAAHGNPDVFLRQKRSGESACMRARPVQAVI